MNPFVAFILGLLAGWLIEWVIDWLYWRRRSQPVAQTGVLERCRGRVSELEQELASYKSQLAALQAETAQPVVTGVRSVQRPVVAEAPAAVVEAAPPDDPFDTIAGMTSELIRRLREAGVRTFAALAALKPQRLREIASDELQEPAAATDIIRQARIAAGTMQKPDDLEIIIGIGPVIARMLNNAGIFTFADLGALDEAGLREIVGTRIERLANEGQILSQARQLAEKQA